MITAIRNKNILLGSYKKVACYNIGKNRTYANIPFFNQKLRNILSNGRDYPFKIHVPPEKNDMSTVIARENEIYSLKTPLSTLTDSKSSKTSFSGPISTQISTIPNGITVASEDIPSEMTALGLFIKSGHRYESEENFGMSYMLEKLAFKSTKTRSSREILEELEFMGAHVSVSCSADMLIYTAEVLRRDVDRTVELINDSISNPIFNDEDLESVLEIIDHELIMAETEYDMLLPELLYVTAYSNSQLGRTVYQMPLDYYRDITKEKLSEYIKNYIVGNRMVLAGCGVSHDQLLSVANKHLSHFPKESPISIPETSPGYTGGVNYLAVEDIEHALVSLHFEFGGIDDPDFYIYFSIYTMLGGGGSFSAGGPGKGMYTRLYLNVLNRYMSIESCEGNISSFKDSGLLGIHGKCDPNITNKFLSIIANEMLRIPKGIDETELSRVKNQMKTSIFYNLESRPILLDDIGRQVVMFGKRYSAEELCEMIDRITEDDIVRCSRKLLSKNPTIIVFAPQSIIDNLPRESDFQHYFKTHLE